MDFTSRTVTVKLWRLFRRFSVKERISLVQWSKRKGSCRFAFQSYFNSNSTFHHSSQGVLWNQLSFPYWLKKKKRILKTRIAQPYWYIPWLWIESWGPDVFLGSLIILLPDVILASTYLRTIGTVYERKKFSLDLREHWKTNLLNIHAE